MAAKKFSKTPPKKKPVSTDEEREPDFTTLKEIDEDVNLDKELKEFERGLVDPVEDDTNGL